MIHTDNFIRFSRVDSVAETATGVLAELHGERLRIDVLRDDVVRIKISRGGEFDETPTYAVCVDPLEAPPDFTVVSDDTGGNVAYSATFNLNPTSGQHEEDVYYVRVFPGGGGGTPTPTPTASPTPTATATASPTATLTPTATPTATSTPTATVTPRPTPTPRSQPTPRARPTPPPRLGLRTT